MKKKRRQEEAKRSEEIKKAQKQKMEGSPKPDEGKNKERMSLRQDIRSWLDRQKDVNELNVESYMSKLLALRGKYKNLQNEWWSDVINLTDVQEAIHWTAQHLRQVTDERDREQLTLIVKNILLPFSNIDPQQFPRVREVLDIIDPNVHQPFTMQTMISLPKILMEDIADADKGSKIKNCTAQA